MDELNSTTATCTKWIGIEHRLCGKPVARIEAEVAFCDDCKAQIRKNIQASYDRHKREHINAAHTNTVD